jgi:hypothetical protein
MKKNYIMIEFDEDDIDGDIALNSIKTALDEYPWIKKIRRK